MTHFYANSALYITSFPPAIAYSSELIDLNILFIDRPSSPFLAY